MKKVAGIDGVFFKCNDPGKMKELYITHLGLNAVDYGATFECREDPMQQSKVLPNGACLLSRRSISILQQRTS